MSSYASDTPTSQYGQVTALPILSILYISSDVNKINLRITIIHVIELYMYIQNDIESNLINLQCFDNKQINRLNLLLN